MSALDTVTSVVMIRFGMRVSAKPDFKIELDPRLIALTVETERDRTERNEQIKLKIASHESRIIAAPG